MQLAQDARAQDRKLGSIIQRPQQAQHDIFDSRLHSAGDQAFHLAGYRSRAHLRRDLGSQSHVELDIDSKQGVFRAGHGFHTERDGHRHGKIVFRVIKIDLAFKHALLASLQHEHRAWLVEHGNVVKLCLGPENADTIKRCRIVPLAGSQLAGQLDQLVLPDPLSARFHRIRQETNRICDRYAPSEDYLSMSDRQ